MKKKAAVKNVGDDLIAFTVEDVAVRLRMRPRKIYQLIREGAIPFVRIGERGLRVPAPALRRLLDTTL
jgi:excisionase family DNA binding protein